MIASLQEEILLLKSYISLERTGNCSLDLSCPDCSLPNTNSSLGSAILNPLLEESIQPARSTLDPFLRQLAQLLEVPAEAPDLTEQLLEAARKFKEVATTPKPPVFVEKIKEIKMPITVEKIIEKPVERIVEKIVERVVYRDDRPQDERTGSRPAFREKLDGYRDRQGGFEVIPEHPREREDEPKRGLNKSYSEKNMGVRMTEREGGWERRYEGQRYGNNLKRRGGEAGKHFRRDYY